MSGRWPGAWRDTTDVTLHRAEDGSWPWNRGRLVLGDDGNLTFVRSLVGSKVDTHFEDIEVDGDGNIVIGLASILSIALKNAPIDSLIRALWSDSEHREQITDLLTDPGLWGDDSGARATFVRRVFARWTEVWAARTAEQRHTAETEVQERWSFYQAIARVNQYLENVLEVPKDKLIRQDPKLESIGSKDWHEARAWWRDAQLRRLEQVGEAVPDEELPPLRVPATTSQWRHYKDSSKIYTVLAVAVRESSGVRDVIYVSTTDPKIWSRPLVEWEQTVPQHGGPRFVPVDPDFA